MNVAQLISILEDYEDHVEVRFAMQPGWPMEYSIRSQTAEKEDENGEITAIYLAQDDHIGYLEESVSEQFGWR